MLLSPSNSLIIKPKESELIKHKQEIKGFVSTETGLYLPTQVNKNLHKKEKKKKQRTKREEYKKLKTKRKR